MIKTLNIEMDTCNETLLLVCTHLQPVQKHSGLSRLWQWQRAAAWGWVMGGQHLSLY